MNLNTEAAETVARLARLYQAPEFPALAKVLQDEQARVTREAIKSADPRICGMAQALINIIEMLDSIPLVFDAQKQRDGLASLPSTDNPRSYHTTGFLRHE